MARSVEDLFKAADEMIEWLLGTEVTEEDIVTALEQSCPGWSEKDRKDVLTVAARIAYRIGDFGFNACAARGLQERLAYPVHYMYVGEMLLVREGLMPRVDNPEALRISMFDRHLENPLPMYPRRDRTKSAET